MSDAEDNLSQTGFDANDHQAAYIYTPAGIADNTPARPVKKRKLSKSRASAQKGADVLQQVQFEPLFDGLESIGCAALRYELYQKAWGATESKIQTILEEANEDTLADVTAFTNEPRHAEELHGIPAGFIVTGPNIASQSLLFDQLSSKLKSDVDGPVVILRSGDATNLKAVLKVLIRDATSQKPSLEGEEEGPVYEQNGRKLLNYDLEILHTYVKARDSQAVVVAFQDSEAFDTSLLADLIGLFNSWTDRMPFVLLFGIATSVDLFHERLSRAAGRCLRGTQFDVEQTSSLLERIFQKAVAGAEAPIRLSSAMVSSLMERQENHVQSVQAFVAALKYTYMCHFYENALSILSENVSSRLETSLQPEHYQAIRLLPSYQNHVEEMLHSGNLERTRQLLHHDDIALLEEVKTSIATRITTANRLLQAVHLMSSISPQPISHIDLYMTIFAGELTESSYLNNILDSIKRMTPEQLLQFIQTVLNAIESGSPAMDLPPFISSSDSDADDEESTDFTSTLTDLSNQTTNLISSSLAGRPIRSTYTLHSTSLRTTVIAQRVQLTHSTSTLTPADKTFTSIINTLLSLLTSHLSLPSPSELFLSESYLYDTPIRHRSAFQPRPRAIIEKALSKPGHYISCSCCPAGEGLSSTHPATSILYQMYLETGGLINVFDLWSAFYEIISSGRASGEREGEEGEAGEEKQMDERDALVLFYRALADLKGLGLVKGSKKKTDHLAKVVWKGL